MLKQIDLAEMLKDAVNENLGSLSWGIISLLGKHVPSCLTPVERDGERAILIRANPTLVSLLTTHGFTLSHRGKSTDDYNLYEIKEVMPNTADDFDLLWHKAVSYGTKE